MSGVTMSTHASHTRCSARSSSALMASVEPEVIASRISRGVPPTPAIAGAESESANATIVLLRSMVLHPPRTVLTEEELSAHVDVQNQQVILVGRELDAGHVDRMRRARERAHTGVDAREPLRRVQHLNDLRGRRRAERDVALGRLLVAGDGHDVLAGDLAEASERDARSEEHTSELQSRGHLVCRLL